jgi:hypothetical protein
MRLLDTLTPQHIVRPVLVMLLFNFMLSAYTLCAFAQATSGQPLTFATPEGAGEALYAASQTHNLASLSQILGPGSEKILSSGDPVEDKEGLDSFPIKYARMHRWVTLTDGSSILYVGADNYPFPIPLARNASSKWYFDTHAGEDELLARRIGRNELLAIDALYGIANAQAAYFKLSASTHAGAQYAQRIISSPGTKDGLFWDGDAGDLPSPIGRLPEFLQNIPKTDPLVIDGYSFRILTAQGAAAPGGRVSYISQGHMTKGYAVLAAPAKYGDSGVMTFILNGDGVVYQRDLGEHTAQETASMSEYDPSTGWQPAE